VTISRASDHRNAVTAKIEAGVETILFAPTPLFEIDFAHPGCDLRRSQIRYGGGLEKFLANITHGKNPNSVRVVI
jgi:hypothetical protein